MASADKLTIETPEQTSLEFSLAGVGSRFLALALDTLIQLIGFLLLLITGMLLAAGNLPFWPGGWTWATAVLVILVFGLYYGYFAFFESIWNGQTPGKRYTRLRVIRDSGHPITVYDAIARNLLRIIDQIPGVYAVGIATALISPQNKRLGDYVAGTVVVHEKPFEEVQPSWEVVERPGSVVYNTGRLSLDEFQLIEAFLQRRSHLSDAVRQQTARQIAERVADKLGIAPADRPRAEALLEAVAREWRRTVSYR